LTTAATNVATRACPAVVEAGILGPAMPEEPTTPESRNLDLVRSIYADWERGDFSRTDWAEPQIEYAFVGGPEPGRWRGLEEMGRAWGKVLRATEDYRVRTVEQREIDHERVLVITRRSGRGKMSGLDLAEMPDENASLFHIRHGKVSKLTLYFERERALADLGLED
jgi:ketosteroid isomerase-like protein